MSVRRLLKFLVTQLATIGFATVAAAATTDIATAPLITSAGSSVFPNLMFVLDDSGSMDWDYLPDYVNDGYCRASGAGITYGSNYTGTFSRPCCQNSNNSGSGSNTCWAGAAPFNDWRGHPLYLTADFNGVYYNPAIRYTPPVNADGTSMASQTSANTNGWQSVRNDAYNKQNSNYINLLSQFPDTEWCTDSTYADCLRNDNYILPGRVGGKDYTVFHAVTAQGTGSVATGAPDVASTLTRNFGPHYYNIVPGEYCDNENLRNCQATQTDVFKFPAPIRWCNSDANARSGAPATGTCQAVQTNVYSYLRFPTKFQSGAAAGVAPTPAKVTFTVTLSGCSSSAKVALSGLSVNGLNLLNSTTSLTNSATTLASSIASQVNARTSNTGYTATSSNASVTITAPASAGALTSTLAFTRDSSSNNACQMTPNNTATVAFSGYVPGTPATPGGFLGRFVRVDIVPGNSYPKAAARTDCAGSTCTYAEEMTNFANWWTYYHTRMQMMKSSAATAFSAVSDQFRVGYLSINNNTGSDFLNIDTFTGSQKTNWFSKLRNARPSNSTPLRTALSRVGRLYGGKLNGTTLNGSTAVDPMQYSCQQNFTLLSTDGYWNETTNPSRLDGTDIGEVDATLSRPMYDGTATPNSLADVAAYYYETDLRSSTFSNCSGALGQDVCTNNVKISGLDAARHQHMTTFTLGLGASGYMQYLPKYQTASSGDYFSVRNGVPANPANGICAWQPNGDCNWPAPANNGPTAIDDLWHAAVNGRGTYFSARDPATLFSGLSSALAQIDTMVGAAAAATTSNPNVSAGDDQVFISKYVSQEWSGELLGQHIDVNTGAVVGSSADWSARTLLNANSNRTIYTFDTGSGNHLKVLNWNNLTSSERAFFELSNITASGRALSQFCTFGANCLTASSQADAAGQKLLQFLLGDRSNEGGIGDTSKYFRERTYLLGDIVNSEAVFVKRAMYDYADPGYGAYKASVASRTPMVYVGANDGMLHAFDANTGAEAWAYVPAMLLPNLYRLADKDYGARHTYYVDGTPATGDAYINGQWRTLLVGGLGAGGRGYYALDVTDPASPRALWEFTNDNLGYTFGKPEITKLKDGTWVVLVSSGYNNVSPGDGRGRLFVLNAADGSLIRTIDTGAGSTATPAGLVGIRAWVDNPAADNTALRVYGGDNLGNVWRFDVNGDVGAPGYDAQLLATLRSASGAVQPVTARPELGAVGTAAVVYVGTGRYLGISDLTDTTGQSIYAIKDNLDAISLGTPRLNSTFVQQTLSTPITCPANATICTSTQTVRTSSSNAADLSSTHNGWYVDLPLSRERANTDPTLALGTLVVTTNIPDATACTVGGSSYINFFDYRTGGPVSTATGVSSVLLASAIATRPTVVRLPNGRVIAITRLSNDSTAVNDVPTDPLSMGTRRVLWRELTTDQ